MRLQLPLSWHSAASQRSTAQHSTAQRNLAHPVSPGDAHLVIQEDDIKACRAQLLGGLQPVGAVRRQQRSPGKIGIPHSLVVTAICARLALVIAAV